MAFEHHIPSSGILVAFALEAWPHLLGTMRRRQHTTSAWSGRLSPRQKELVPFLLSEIAARGPLCSEDFAGSGRARSVWGSATQAKATLQKLFFHGRLLIARRGDGQRRYYDLAERVLPAKIRAATAPARLETARWEVLLKLRQRRLTQLKKAELPLVQDLVQPVQVDGCPPLYCLREDLGMLELAARGPGPEDDHPGFPDPVLLAPLDPLIYDRRVTSCLWGFDYTWEAYTPPQKRLRGYYALPVLVGTDMVGHIDPKADRRERKLRVMARSVRRGQRVAPAVKRLAQFLGLA